jgi:hypothetical protein
MTACVLKSVFADKLTDKKVDLACMLRSACFLDNSCTCTIDEHEHMRKSFAPSYAEAAIESSKNAVVVAQVPDLM